MENLFKKHPILGHSLVRALALSQTLLNPQACGTCGIFDNAETGCLKPKWVDAMIYQIIGAKSCRDEWVFAAECYSR